MEWKKSNIRQMFALVAPRYDFLNMVLSFGMDRTWRKKLAGMADPKPGSRVLDLCTGTADIALEFASMPEVDEVVGVDFSPEMLRGAVDKARLKGVSGRIRLMESDVLELSLPPGQFDIVTMGFGLRNLLDPYKGLAVMASMLKKGGKALILELMPPDRSVFGTVYGFHLTRILPGLAAMFGDSVKGYSYLSSSVSSYVKPRQVATWMRVSGFYNVRCERLCGGVVYIYFGEKRKD